MNNAIRLPRVCASRNQARNAVASAPQGETLHLDALDTIYSSPTFAEELLREAFAWGFEKVHVYGAPPRLRSDLQEKASARTGDYYMPVIVEEAPDAR